MIGRAFIFIRWHGGTLINGVDAGHVGWGFLNAIDGSNETYYYGSTENPGGHPRIEPGHDNGFWSQYGNGQSMYNTMRQVRNGGKTPPYDACRWITVDRPNPRAGYMSAEKTRNAGYLGVTNNCMDHVFQILTAYGVIDLLPPARDWFPNNWYNHLLYFEPSVNL